MKKSGNGKSLQNKQFNGNIKNLVLKRALEKPLRHKNLLTPTQIKTSKICYILKWQKEISNYLLKSKKRISLKSKTKNFTNQIKMYHKTL